MKNKWHAGDEINLLDKSSISYKILKECNYEKWYDFSSDSNKEKCVNEHQFFTLTHILQLAEDLIKLDDIDYKEVLETTIKIVKCEYEHPVMILFELCKLEEVTDEISNNAGIVTELMYDCIDSPFSCDTPNTYIQENIGEFVI